MQRGAEKLVLKLADPVLVEEYDDQDSLPNTRLRLSFSPDGAMPVEHMENTHGITVA